MLERENIFNNFNGFLFLLILKLKQAGYIH